jgi:hypothetical protein
MLSQGLLALLPTLHNLNPSRLLTITKSHTDPDIQEIKRRAKLQSHRVSLMNHLNGRQGAGGEAHEAMGRHQALGSSPKPQNKEVNKIQ